MKDIIIMLCPVFISFVGGVIAGIVVPNFKRYMELKKQITNDITIEARLENGKVRTLHFNRMMNKHEIEAVFRDVLNEA